MIAHLSTNLELSLDESLLIISHPGFYSSDLTTQERQECPKRRHLDENRKGILILFLLIFRIVLPTSAPSSSDRANGCSSFAQFQATPKRQTRAMKKLPSFFRRFRYILGSQRNFTCVQIFTFNVQSLGKKIKNSCGRVCESGESPHT